uniref:Glycosyl transferase family 1 n=2 Tax=uncultured Chloroflexota bacterium TaxID=166587 RepID=H5SBC3_9CHLR|nr:glycosyl transferase family 1 [uncultured Chloroflexota bacterium]
MKRILLSAFACAPGYGSEPNVGWETVRQVSRCHQVWVLTHPANRPYIEKAVSEQNLSNAQFVYLALPAWLEAIAWKSGFHQIYYMLWQWKVSRAARRLHRCIQFDIAHHVTYVNSWIAPGLVGAGLPFIWNAGTRAKTPWPFLQEMSWRERIREINRNLAIKTIGMISAKSVQGRVKYILSSSPQQDWGYNLPLVPFTIGGLNAAELHELAIIPMRTAVPFRLASIGRFEGWKGFGMGLRAFARIHRIYPKSEYWLVGNGTETPYLRRLASESGVENAVKFLPWQPRERLWQLLKEIDVLVHPSLHEQFGYVILEAMAAGRPVICVDVGGPSLLVEEEFGFKIPVSNPKQVVDELVNALHQLITQPEKRLQMGKNARRTALEKWSWEIVGERLLALYER